MRIYLARAAAAAVVMMFSVAADAAEGTAPAAAIAAVPATAAAAAAQSAAAIMAPVAVIPLPAAGSSPPVAVVPAPATGAAPAVATSAVADPAIAAAAAAAGAGAAPEIAPPGRVSQVVASGRPFSVEVGKGILIRLPRPASTVFIADPNVADVNVKSPSLIYLTAKSVGETALYALDAQDHVLVNSAVHVTAAMEPIRAALHQLQVLGLGDDVKANWVDNTLVLTGIVATARRAEMVRAAATSVAGTVPGSTVLDRMAIATPNQVNVRVKIAQVDRTVSKALGFNWTKATGNPTFNSELLSNPAELLGNSTLTSPPTITYALPGTGRMIEATLDALAADGLAKTLAEPNLTVSNNQTANFVLGGTVYITNTAPISSTTSTSVAFTTTAPLPVTFGTQLYVTPTILDAAHLTLHIRPVISEPTVINGNPNSFTQTSAETTVELGSGETFVLGGLLQDLSSETISKIPGLGDIPILGQLFRSQAFQRHETELVILVTPYLVEPSTTALSAPTDGLEWPHDISQVFTGATYRQTLPAPAGGPVAPPGAGQIGAIGFRLD
jgi:pilus assembly protein CpaC